MGNVSTKEARSRSNSGRSSSVSQAANQSSRRHHRSARNQAGTGGDRAKGSDKKSNGGSLVLDPNEMVDGGYLAPHGVYSGPQTYKHKIVRQLMIERRLAPFFKGLADYDEDWSERQLLAAIRGIPLSAVNPDENNNNNDGGSTGDLTSTSITEENTTGMHEDDDVDTTATSADILSSSVPNDKGSLSTSPSKQAGPGLGSASSSPLPPHAESSSSESDRDPELEKILEMKGEAYHMEYSCSAQDDDETKRRSQSVSSPTTSVANVAAATSFITTRQRANTSSRYNQANGAGDGKPVELVVYKGAIECPICFLFYPKYLNHTRCCAQPICSECFVQIKRPDPHPPYHEGGSSEEQSSTSNNTTNEKEHELVSEPACCPYCTAPDFGVIYIPPPFRSGLAQASSSSSKLHLPSLFSSNHGSSGTSTPASDHTTESDGRPRRHRTSVPPSAPEVVTTDQIRPDWSANLHAARQHQARRSAAANALHATAFLMNNSNDGGSSSSSSRAKKKKSSRLRNLASPSVVGNGRTQTPVPSTSSGESSSRQGLEDMMLVEAIRLSLSEEDSRKKKEKEQKKKAKGKQPEGIPS